MPKFGQNSLKHRSTVSNRLKSVVDKAIEVFDFSFVCGRRSKEDQDKAVRDGYSKVKWPNSRHNVLNSEEYAKAMDLYPYPTPPWTGDIVRAIEDLDDTETIIKKMKDWARWYYLAGLLKGIAHEQGIDIRQGCNWDGDSDFNDQHFDDLPHHEL